MALLRLLPALALLTLIFGMVRITYVFRARAMRSLASRWGFQYMGPSFSGWRTSSHTLINLPPQLSLANCLAHGRRIRKVWNVIEGQHGGSSVLIFDSIVGEGRGVYCTFFACQTEQNPFGMRTVPDQVIQSHGWTVLFRLRFLQVPSTIGVRSLEDHLNKLQVGSVSDAAC